MEKYRNYRPYPKRKLWIDILIGAVSLGVLVGFTVAVVEHLAR